MWVVFSPVFAEGWTVGEVLGASGGLVTLLGAIGALIALLRKSRTEASQAEHAQRKENDATALAEYRILVDSLRSHQKEQDKRNEEDKRILSERMFKLEGEVGKCHEHKALIAAENASFRETIRFLERDVRALENASGRPSPSSSMPAVITASMDGTIVEASPSTSQMFHWTSTELVGKSVEVLIPDRYLDAHRAGMAKLREAGRPPDDLVTGEPKSVVGSAKDRGGEEIPVVVFLTGWQDDHGKWMVSAEIVRRRGRPKTAAGGNRPGDTRFRVDDGSKEMRALQ